jgi:signal transduction histidine kinase
MQGFAEALLEDYGDRLDDVGRDYATRVVNASKRMDLLIQDLLAYSRLTRTEIELRPTDVAQLAHGIVAQNDFTLRRNGAQIEIVEPMPHVHAHRATLTQVLTNLLSNAVKFVPPSVVPRVVVRGERQDGRVRVWVEDNGIGIPPEHHDRIFRVFERLHPLDVYPGTGIGLAIVRKAVERMGGRVGLESEPDRGTRFWFELAAAPDAADTGDGD